MLQQEKVSFYTHFSAAILSAAGCALLIYITCCDPLKMFVSLIYGLSVTALFTASSVYHARKKSENDTTVWRKLDHSAIFMMIAGSYTPISYLYLPENWFIGIVSAQWALVALGIIFKFVFLKAPRVFSTSVYLAMGWMAVIPIGHLKSIMPLDQFVMLFAGGAAYSIGAVIYALKKPVLKEGVFGFHEIFHIMIIIGAAFHYVIIFRGMSG
jgi:hemolysin III